MSAQLGAASDAVWRARFERERAARKAAERLLETKARELFLRNRDLAEAATTLEERVAARTAELEQALAASAAASRARLAFLAMVSHELRTPLNSILGGLGLVQEEPLDEESRRSLTLVRGSADGLLRIIDDILDLARMESGRIAVEASAFDAAELLADTVETLRPAAARRGLGLEVDCAGLVPARLVTDAGRIRQVVVNLVGNALKFTPSGTVRVVARLVEGPALDVAVTDTGPGLTPEDRERLFQPFARVGKSGRDRLTGTGLGLAISRHITETLGGAIGVESAPGQGSTFRFRVPVAPAPEAPPPAAAAAAASSGTPAAPARRGRILVVDDIATNSHVAAAHLRRAGHEVDTAGSGAEAVEAAAARRYDLIFMDLLMPDMDGLETTRAIRALGGAQPPILGLTASVLGDVRAECAAAGMDEVLAKPISGPRLAQAASLWMADGGPTAAP